MECRVSYFRLLLPIIFINLVVVPLVLLINKNLVVNLLLLLAGDATFIVAWLLRPPVVWIFLNRQTGTFSYQTFVGRVTTVSVSAIRSQLVTRRNSASGQTARLLLHYQGDGLAALNLYNWPNSQLEKLHQLLNKQQ
jgi:hypothetical protein